MFKIFSDFYGLILYFWPPGMILKGEEIFKTIWSRVTEYVETESGHYFVEKNIFEFLNGRFYGFYRFFGQILNFWPPGLIFKSENIFETTLHNVTEYSEIKYDHGFVEKIFFEFLSGRF